MNVEIKSRDAKPLLEREEIRAVINYEGPAPKRLEVQKALASAAKAKQNLTIIRKVDAWYGETKADVSALIYKSEESMKKIEPSYMVNRNTEKKEESAEKPAATEEKKEAPAENAEEAVKEVPEEKKEDKTEEAAKEESTEVKEADKAEESEVAEDKGE